MEVLWAAGMQRLQVAGTRRVTGMLQVTGMQQLQATGKTVLKHSRKCNQPLGPFTPPRTLQTASPNYPGKSKIFPECVSTY